MGVMFSSVRSPHRRNVAFEAIEPELETGDVMLFATTGPDNYLARLGSWHQSSQSGFLIRDKSGVEGLHLCHSCLTEGPQLGSTQLISLRQFFAESPFDTVIIRRLCVPLTEEQKRQVASFAHESEGEKFNRKVTLLMQRTDLPWMCASIICLHWSKHSVERFICSELVVKMLQNLEMVKGDNKEYIPVVSRQTGRRVTDSTLYQSSIIVKSS